MNKVILGKGHELLSCFNVEYEFFVHPIVKELMSHPEKRYKLFLKEISPKKNKQTEKTK